MFMPKGNIFKLTNIKIMKARQQTTALETYAFNSQSFLILSLM